MLPFVSKNGPGHMPAMAALNECPHRTALLSKTSSFPDLLFKLSILSHQRQLPTWSHQSFTQHTTFNVSTSHLNLFQNDHIPIRHHSYNGWHGNRLVFQSRFPPPM